MEKYCKRFYTSFWIDTSLEEACKNIAGVGCMDAVTAKKFLEAGAIIQTVRAIYRKGSAEEFNNMIAKYLTTEIQIK